MRLEIALVLLAVSLQGDIFGSALEKVATIFGRHCDLWGEDLLSIELLVISCIV